MKFTSEKKPRSTLFDKRFGLNFDESKIFHQKSFKIGETISHEERKS